LSLGHAEYFPILRPFVDWLSNELERQDSKLSAVRKIMDPTCLVDKTGIEWRLLSSLCYDVARTYVTSFYAFDKKMAFEAFWAHLSNLHKFEKMKLPRYNTTIGLKSLLLKLFSVRVKDFQKKCTDKHYHFN